MSFRAKCDLSIKGVCVCLPFVMAAVDKFCRHKANEEVLIQLLVALCVSALLYWAFARTRYIFQSESLLIRGVFSRIPIKYEDIDSIERKNGFLSMEAPSVPQLWLLKGEHVLGKVSPKEIDAFEEELQKRIAK